MRRDWGDVVAVTLWQCTDVEVKVTLWSLRCDSLLTSKLKWRCGCYVVAVCWRRGWSDVVACTYCHCIDVKVVMMLWPVLCGSMLTPTLRWLCDRYVVAVRRHRSRLGVVNCVVALVVWGQWGIETTNIAYKDGISGHWLLTNRKLKLFFFFFVLFFFVFFCLFFVCFFFVLFFLLLLLWNYMILFIVNIFI